MDILLEFFFGSYAGWMTSRKAYPVPPCLALGVLGAVSSSLLMQAFGFAGVSGYNIYSFVVAMAGAVACVYIGRALRTPRLA